MNSTLVLNFNFEPISCISWSKALTLYYKNKVEIVESYATLIRSPSVTIQMPAVVRILKQIPYRLNAVKLTKSSLFFRDRGRCSYCLKKLSKHNATLDHVMPKSRFGETVWENVVSSCKKCNNKKGNLTPEEAGFKLNFKPFRPTIYTFLMDSLKMNKVWIKYLRST